MFCLRTFCPYGRFVPTDVSSPRTFGLPDVLSLPKFCLYGRFVHQTLCIRLFCLRTFCPYRRFVPTDFLSLLTFLSPDVLSGHQFSYVSTIALMTGMSEMFWMFLMSLKLVKLLAHKEESKAFIFPQAQQCVLDCRTSCFAGLSIVYRVTELPSLD